MAIAVGVEMAVGVAGTGVRLGSTVAVKGRTVIVNGRTVMVYGKSVSVGRGVTVLPGNGVGYGVRVAMFGTQRTSPA